MAVTASLPRGDRGRHVHRDGAEAQAERGRFCLEPEITARRVISWLTHSPLILQDVDHAFYRSFLKSLSRQVRYLRGIYPATREGYPRLLVAISKILPTYSAGVKRVSFK